MNTETDFVVTTDLTTDSWFAWIKIPRVSFLKTDVWFFKMADPVERTEMRRKIMTGSLNPTQRTTILPFENCCRFKTDDPWDANVFKSKRSIFFTSGYWSKSSHKIKEFVFLFVQKLLNNIRSLWLFSSHLFLLKSNKLRNLGNLGERRGREKERERNRLSHDAKGTIVCECSRFYAREIADHDGN